MKKYLEEKCVIFFKVRHRDRIKNHAIFKFLAKIRENKANFRTLIAEVEFSVRGDTMPINFTCKKKFLTSKSCSQ